MRAALFAVATLGAVFPRAASAQDCREFEAGEEIATLADVRINEASGLSAGWLNPDLLWTHNDSGDEPRVFAIDHDGQTRAVVNLLGATAVDFEDIAVGPCSESDSTPCVWVGDIGDNDELRASITLYRFVEPDLTDATSLDVNPDAISVTYDGGARDAEALMVHPLDGRVFIVDKTVGDPTHLWLVPTDGSPASVIATTSLGEVGVIAGRVTGADYAPNGAEFSVRTYTHIYTFCGADPVAAFEGARSSIIGTRLFQSEALTYSRDGYSIFTTTEVRAAEEPALLQMQLVGGPPEPTPIVRDAGHEDASPSNDLGDDALSIVIVDADSPSGCSCFVAGKRAEPPWGLGLLAAIAMLGRLRKRPRHS